MVEMTCEDHDRIAASTQFMTHTVGRILGSMELGSTPIDTKGFQSLLSLVDNTTHDSFDLYYGLFMYNAVRTFLRPPLTPPQMASAASSSYECRCMQRWRLMILPAFCSAGGCLLKADTRPFE